MAPPRNARGDWPLAFGIVVIGRNEGQRLVDCLASMPAGVPLVYVDSASTDDSVRVAKDAGAHVHALDMSTPFSAARARNEGRAALAEIATDLEAVHFFDGDTVLQEGWLDLATSFLARTPQAVAVAGRRRERYPQASWFNALCDIEWDTPVGEAAAVGGDALYRLAPFDAAGGFNPTVIAGEEPELCFRLRQEGGTVHRLDAEMTLHDAAITSFGPWWQRAIRSGYAWMLGALLHGRSGYNVREVVRSLIWGAALPLIGVLCIFLGFARSPGWWLATIAIVALYVQKWRRVRSYYQGRDAPTPGRVARWVMLMNVAEVLGIAKCLTETAKGERRIVEYK